MNNKYGTEKMLLEEMNYLKGRNSTLKGEKEQLISLVKDMDIKRTTVDINANGGMNIARYDLALALRSDGFLNKLFKSIKGL